MIEKKDTQESLIEDVRTFLDNPPAKAEAPARLFDDAVPTGMVEVNDPMTDAWVPVNATYFRKYAGRRRLLGVEYHGPVFIDGVSDVVYTGPRICSCDKCQSTSAPASRYN
jgi:hypothetical protein